VLSERVDESLIAPIPMAMAFDDAGLEANPVALVGRLGDVVGFGDFPGLSNGVRRVAFDATALLGLRSSFSERADGSPMPSIVMDADGTSNGGASHIDWGAPLLMNIAGRTQVVAVADTGLRDRSADLAYQVPLSTTTRPLLERFLDPDGDGIHRGHLDADPADPEYVDRDGDGLSEYRVPPGRAPDDDCIAPPPEIEAELGLSPGSCLLPTHNDNCPPPLTGPAYYAYANRDQRDRDGDGRGDVCDTCPIVWQASHDLSDGELFCAASRPVAPDSPAGLQMGRGLRRGEPVSEVCIRGELDRQGTSRDETDLDADGVLDLCDNCPGVANPDQADFDEDGYGDLCDVCEGPEAPPAETCRDLDDCAPDARGCVGGACECRRDSHCQEGHRCIESRCHVDVDEDGAPDACDNCPPSACDSPAECANPDQADSDRLGMDRGDGVGDLCDNCPGHRNRSQANCNLDAELDARSADPTVELLGDACDPVPCAPTTLTERRSSTDLLGRTSYRMDQLEYDPGLGSATPGVDPAPIDGRTTLRWCRCRNATANTPAALAACREPVQETLSDGTPVFTGEGDCALRDIERHDFDDEGLPWRWTTQTLIEGSLPACDTDAECGLGFRCVGAGAGVMGRCRCASPLGCPSGRVTLTNPTLVDRYEAPDDSFVPVRETLWRFHDVDIPRWLIDEIVPSVPFDPASPPSQVFLGETFPPRGAVEGVLWTHTPGEVGQPDFDEVPAAGAVFRGLASHYWSGGVTPEFTTREPFPCFIPFLPFLGGTGICPFCRTQVPQPWIVFPGAAGCVDFRFDVPFLQLGIDPIDPFAGLPLAGLEVFANDPGPWVAAAETGSWLPDGEGLRYAKLEDGNRVQRLVIEVQDRLVDPQSNDNCPQPPCEPIPAPFVAVAASDDADGPVARDGHAAVLSATRRALWVVGGRARSGGAELRDVWRHDVETTTWRRLWLGSVALGHVLAATYSPVDERLWILDETYERPGRGHRRRRGRGRRRGPPLVRRARLITVHPDFGTAEVVATWRRVTANAEFELSVDPSGALWVAAWRERGGAHVVVRLDTDAPGTVRVLGWRIGAGALAPDGVRADARGLTVIRAATRRRGPRMEHHEAVDLWPVPGGEAACF